MGVISILLGIIAFIGLTGTGAILGNQIVNYKANVAMKLTGLGLENISDTGIMVGFVCVFGVIGLLICVNMVMQGLTYNKIVKIQKRIRHL